jgi:hypothetical protein
VLDFVKPEAPEGSLSALVGRHGSIKPAGRVRIRILNMAGYSAGGGKEKSPGQWWPGLKIAEYPAPEARGAQSISHDGTRQAPPGCEARSARGLR